MSLDLHTIAVADGSVLASNDRIAIGVQNGLANAAGAAGVTVSVAVVFANLPPNYTPVVNPGQGCGWSVTNKTANGFTVNLIPFVSTASIAAGTFDVAVFG